MTERDLNALKSLPVPPSRDAARRAALEAALEAFDQNAKGENAPQGTGATARPTPAPHPAVRRKFMHFTRTQYAMAASVAALMIAAPAAFHVMQDARFETATRGLDGGSNVPDSGRIAGGEKLAAEESASRKNEIAAQATASAVHDDKAASRDEHKQDTPVATEKTIEETRAYPPDLVGKSQIGAAEPVAGPTDGLGAVVGNDRRLPYAREQEKLARDGAQAQPQVAAAPPPPPPSGRKKERTAPRSDSGFIAPTDGLGAVGGGVSQPLATPGGGAAGSVPPPAVAVAPAKPIDGLGPIGNFTGLRTIPSDREVGRRMMNGPAAEPAASLDGRMDMAKLHDPYAHMQEVERQRAIAEQEYRDKFESKDVSPVKQVAADPVSTFSIDVDTASYSFVRRALNGGQLPPKDSVRVEEMINYFPYEYPRPESAETPFQPTVTVLPSPWNASNQLVHIAIKGYEIAKAERPRANLVFLMDVSGSMQPADRLPLVKNAFRMLVDELKPDDTVAIVTYASGSGVALEPTKISDKSKILAAIDRLGAGGSTAGAQGIQDAYRLAEQSFDTAAVNRVILATDGDFNVGVTSHDELKGLIERKREKGIFLSILGVGQGNYNDSLMQTLAQNGNGTAAYVDTLNEARKVLVDEASSTLFTIAKDVKIQVEWNPTRVQEYRLVGYETRALKREDFNNDKVDAGDIGSGHTVTAIYEITPVGAPAMVDGLRYQTGPRTASAERMEPAAMDGEIGFLKLRYKLPKEDASKLVTLPIADALAKDRVDGASADARFSVAVAAFGQLLKGAPYLKGYGYDDVIALAQSAKGEDRFGYRAEMINLVRMAKSARP